MPLLHDKEERKYYLFKITRDTNLWKKGQKVWAYWTTGACAASVMGRYKGKGRWINGWVHWGDPGDKDPNKHYLGGRIDAKWIGRIKVKNNLKEILEKKLF